MAGLRGVAAQRAIRAVLEAVGPLLPPGLEAGDSRFTTSVAAGRPPTGRGAPGSLGHHQERVGRTAHRGEQRDSVWHRHLDTRSARSA